MIELLRAAIQQRKRIRWVYEPGSRIIEPHCLGESADGHLLLRAFQVSGASASHEHHDWKLFRLDRVEAANDTDEVFDGPRPGYKRGDKAMKGRIIAQL